MEIILKNVKEKDLPVLESLAKAMGFEIAERNERQYNPEFVDEIREAEQNLKDGKGIKVTMDELNALWK